MMTKDVNVVLVDFPNTKTRETVTENEDGTFTIFINSRQAPNIQLEAYEHAMRHIEQNDFEKEEDVQVIEAIAHQAKVTMPVPKQMPVKKKRKRQNRYGKYLIEKKKREEFLRECGIELDRFAEAERQYLYGEV